MKVGAARKPRPASAGCRGLPYAALLVNLEASRSWHLQLQGLSFDVGFVPKDWSSVYIYHAHKPKKPRTAYSGYRTLGLNMAEARLHEELWMILAGEAAWAVVGSSQEARKDTRVPMRLPG